LAQSKVSILNFYARVFASADVDSAIVIFQKGDAQSKSENVRLLEWTTEPRVIVDSPKSQFLSQTDAIINIEALKSGDTGDLMTKIEKGTRPLKEIANVKCGLGAYGRGDGIPPQTDEMIKARVYHSKSKVDESWFKYVEGVDVKRYALGWHRKEYLKWGRNLREPRNDWRLYSTPRILVRQIPSPQPYCINACFTAETFLNDRNSMNIINIAIQPELVWPFSIRGFFHTGLFISLGKCSEESSRNLRSTNWLHFRYLAPSPRMRRESSNSLNLSSRPKRRMPTRTLLSMTKN
jgi:hypothetical protein